MSNPIDFIREFLKYTEKVGIYDEFDKESQKMKTSAGVQNLIDEARTYLPPRLKGLQAANAMRDLPEEMRDKLISQSDAKRVVDLRTAFARKQAANGGAQGLLRDLLVDFEAGNVGSFEQRLRDAKGIIDNPETVYDTAEEVNQEV